VLAASVGIVRRGGDTILRLDLRDVLTAERVGWTASATLKEEEAADQQTNQDCHIEHNPHEMTDGRSWGPNHVAIHVRPFDAPIQQPAKTLRVAGHGRQRIAMKSVDFG
jgi:hypothetical protein